MLYTIVLIEMLFCMFIYNNYRLAEKKKGQVIIAILFLTLALISSCMYEWSVRGDFYKNYLNCLRTANQSWAQIFSIREEVLHSVLRKLVMLLFHDPQAWFFVAGFFIVAAHFLFFKKCSPDFMFSLILFYTIGGYFTSHNITRQYIAISITLFAFKYIIENKPIKFTLLVLLAMGFHQSAIVVIPLFFLRRIQFNRFLLLIYIFLGAFAAVFSKQVTMVIQLLFYSDYGQGYGAETSNVIRLIWTLIGIGCSWLLNRRTKSIQYFNAENELFNTQFENAICHGAILYAFFSVLSATSMLMFTRVAAYFSAYNTLVMLYGISDVSRSMNRRVLKGVLLALAIAWFAAMNITGSLYPTPFTPFWEITGRMR